MEETENPTVSPTTILYQSDLPGEGFFDDEKIRVNESGGGPGDDDSRARAAAPAAKNLG